MPKTTRHTPEIIQQMKDAIGDSGNIVLSHWVSLDPGDGSWPLLFTIDLAREPGGLFVATCRELPKVLVAGPDEGEALARAEMQVRLLLGGGHWMGPDPSS